MKKFDTILRPWREAPVSQVGQRKPGRELAAVLRDMGFKVEVA